MNSAVNALPDIERIVRQFEEATIDPGDFNHESHLMVAWWYLQKHTLLDAISCFIGAIRNLTRKLGVTSKYHETITLFYLIKIAERCGAASGADWTTFKAANPDLFTWNPSLVQQFYSDALLSSDSARHNFVLPDRAP